MSWPLNQFGFPFDLSFQGALCASQFCLSFCRFHVRHRPPSLSFSSSVAIFDSWCLTGRFQLSHWDQIFAFQRFSWLKNPCDCVAPASRWSYLVFWSVLICLFWWWQATCQTTVIPALTRDLCFVDSGAPVLNLLVIQNRAGTRTWESSAA